MLQGSRWRVTDLTYRVTKYPTTTRLKKSQVSENVRWAKQTIEMGNKLNYYR